VICPAVDQKPGFRWALRLCGGVVHAHAGQSTMSHESVSEFLGDTRGHCSKVPKSLRYRSPTIARLETHVVVDTLVMEGYAGGTTSWSAPRIDCSGGFSNNSTAPLIRVKPRYFPQQFPSLPLSGPTITMPRLQRTPHTCTLLHD
jgi:hypothetical protein